MQRVLVLLLACYSADASLPPWACSLAAAPKKEPIPSGSASVDQAAVDAELADAQATSANAQKLGSVAHDNRTDSKDAAQLEDDASHLLKEAAKETKEVGKLVKLVHKEQAQKVTAVNGESLSKLIEQKQELLVVFYAPWCGHCKTFVMSDDSGNPEKAPLELLNKEFEAATGPKIVKFNVDAGGAIPTGFEVQFIPTVYMVSNGAYKKFEGNPHDFSALKSFAGIKAAMVQSKVTLHMASKGFHNVSDTGIPQTGWANGKRPGADKMPVDVGERVQDSLGRILPTHMDGLTHTSDWGSEYGPMKPANTINLHGSAPKSSAGSIHAAAAVLAAAAVQLLL